MSVKSIATAYCPVFLRSSLNRVTNSPIGYRMASGMFWSIAGSIISRGLGLVSWILVARMLGKTTYGELGIIQSTVGMFGIFAGFGMGLTATKYVAEHRKTNPELAGRIIGLSGLFTFFSGGFIAVTLFILAPWLAEHTINAPHLSGILRISSLILFVSALNGAQVGALSGFEAFKTIAYVNLFVCLISFPTLLILVYFGGLSGAVWALIINYGANWLLNHLALRKEARRYSIPFKLKGCTREMPILWKFSLPAVLGSIIVSPVNWICGALLVNQPEGYSEMGIFNAAHQWQIAILFIPGMLCQVALPLLTNLNAECEGQKYRKVLVLNVILNAGVAMAVAVPVMLFAYFIMRAYGLDFVSGTNALRALAFATVLMAANSVIGQAIASKGKMWTGFFFNILWAIALLSVTGIFIYYDSYGAFGRACALLIAFVLHTVWQSIYLAHLIRVKKPESALDSNLHSVGQL